MPSVLIADACKSSLVMTSEAIKDNFHNSLVSVAPTGKSCFDQLKERAFDFIVLDFELPDTDAITLTKLIRKEYNTPIIITAYPDKSVKEAISKELFMYADASSWISKPIDIDKLVKQIELVLQHGEGVARSFKTDLSAVLTLQKTSGRRVQRVHCQIVDMSLSGVVVNPEGAVKLDQGDRVTLSCKLEHLSEGAGTSQVEKKPKKASDLRVNSTVIDKPNKGSLLGLEFSEVSDTHKRNLERYLRHIHENHES